MPRVALFALACAFLAAPGPAMAGATYYVKKPAATTQQQATPPALLPQTPASPGTKQAPAPLSAACTPQNQKDFMALQKKIEGMSKTDGNKAEEREIITFFTNQENMNRIIELYTRCYQLIPPKPDVKKSD